MANPVAGTSVDFEVSDIEDAGIQEVLQTPGAAYGAWSILDALLTPTGVGTPFIFREPLGQPERWRSAFSPCKQRSRPSQTPCSQRQATIRR